MLYWRGGWGLSEIFHGQFSRFLWQQHSRGDSQGGERAWGGFFPRQTGKHFVAFGRFSFVILILNGLDEK